MTVADRRLAFARDCAKIAARALRLSLAESLRWRSGGGAPPTDDAFVTATLATVRDMPDWTSLDGRTRLRFMRRLGAKARSYVRSPLGRRLRTVPPERLLRTPTSDRPDILLRDPSGEVHLVVITSLVDPLELAEHARSIEETIDVPLEARLSPLTIHLYSLRTNRRFAYRFESRSASRRFVA